MIKVECISEQTKNFISANRAEDDVARFWVDQLQTTKEDLKFFLFDDEVLEDGQWYDANTASGEIRVMAKDGENDVEVRRITGGQEGSWPYDEEMNFTGYNFGG